MSKENGSGYSVYIKGPFEYRGHVEDVWDYELTGDELMSGIREYFDKRLVNLDGTDSAIFNTLSELNVLDDIIDEMEDWYKEQFAEKAKEDFLDWASWYYDDEEEEEA